VLSACTFFTLESKYQGFLRASNYTCHVAGKIVWRLEVLSLWLGNKPSGEGGSVTSLVLQVHFCNHTELLGESNPGTWSRIKNHHWDLPCGFVHQLVTSPLPNLHINWFMTSVKPSAIKMYIICWLVLVMGSLFSMEILYQLETLFSVAKHTTTDSCYNCSFLIR